MQLCFDLAIILICGLVVGEVARFFRTPKVTGYILAGTIIGPPALGWIRAEDITSLNVISEVALVAIMFMIGTEFESSHFRRVGKRILTISACEAGVTFIVVGVAASIGGILTMASLPEWGTVDSIRLGLLLGTLAIATAPAATLLVIKEHGSEGPVTESILALVALNNLVCILLFYVIFITAGIATDITTSEAMLQLAYNVLGSAVVGIGIGLAISYLDRKIIGKEQMVVTAGGILFITGLSKILPISSMLTALVFGIIFVNAAVDPRKVTDEIYKTALPLYVAFFVLAGAELHIKELAGVGVVGIFYVIARSLAKWLGIYGGCRFTDSPYTVKRFLGLGMLCQAGVAIGLVSVAAKSGGEIGYKAQTTILASVVVFEIIGPILVEISVIKAGEVKLVNLLHRERGEHQESDIVAVISDLLSSFGYDIRKKKLSISELRVKHVMRQNVKAIPEDANLDEILHFIDHSKYNHFPVVDKEDRFKGIVSFEEIRNVLFNESMGNLVIANDLAHEAAPILLPEDTLEQAISKFDECGFGCLPVVAPRDPRKLIGLLEQRSVLRVYHEKTQTGNK